MARMGNDEVATAELAAVLAELGIDVEPVADPDADGDLLLAGEYLIEVKASSRPTISRLVKLGTAARHPSPHVVHVLVANQLDPAARRMLEEAGWGWLDRSGHLRLVAGTVHLDRPIRSLTGPEPAPPRPLERPTGLAVALALLEVDEWPSIRAIADEAGVSVGAAHAAVTELEAAGLLAERRRRDPELFWEVARHWRVRWFALRSGPLPGVPEATQRLLRIRWDEPELPGWAEVGDAAAQFYGARVAASTRPRLYLPDQRALTWTLRTWPETAEERSATAFVAVPPTVSATTHRVEAHREWLLARPIVVALDLASDLDPRSREILDDWDPTPVGADRVW